MFYESPFDLEATMRKIIRAIESSRRFDPEALGEATGLGQEAVLAYKNYVAGKGLVTKASVNWYRFGLNDITLIASVPTATLKKADLVPNTRASRAYVVGYSLPTGQAKLILRALIPRKHKATGLGLLEKLKAAGILKDYEIFEPGVVPTRFSFDPSAFDYSRGTWRIPPSTTSAQDRQLVRADTAPIEFDEVDLRIAEALKKSAAMKPEAMATALGISLEEVEDRLEKRAFDERRGFVLSNFVDFFEPGLFAPETAVITAFFKCTDEKLRDALLKVPYLSAVWPAAGKNRVCVASFYSPYSYVFTLARQVEQVALECDAEDLTLYLSPWYAANELGSPHYTADLHSVYVNGDWVFDADEVFSEIKTALNIRRATPRPLAAL